MEAETHDAVWKPKQKFVMDGLCNTHDEYIYFPVQPPYITVYCENKTVCNSINIHFALISFYDKLIFLFKYSSMYFAIIR